MRLDEHQTLYVQELGQVVRVTAIFADADEANQYLGEHPEEGVIKEISPFIFLAGIDDLGVKVSTA